jgi:NAD(P)-dependent dehydrogenase (short-subunit alcohol dehydrogenase family)
VVKEIEGYGRRGLALRLDCADPEAVTAAVDRAAAEFGRLDILVNNAALFPVGPVEESGVAEFDRTIAVNVRAPFVASKHFASATRRSTRTSKPSSNASLHRKTEARGAARSASAR